VRRAGRLVPPRSSSGFAVPEGRLGIRTGHGRHVQGHWRTAAVAGLAAKSAESERPRKPCRSGRAMSIRLLLVIAVVISALIPLVLKRLLFCDYAPMNSNAVRIT
jgi:hypothetical protein